MDSLVIAVVVVILAAAVGYIVKKRSRGPPASAAPTGAAVPTVRVAVPATVRNNEKARGDDPLSSGLSIFYGASLPLYARHTSQ